MDSGRIAGMIATLGTPFLLACGLLGTGCAHMDALPSAQQDGKTFRSIGIATADNDANAPESNRGVSNPAAPIVRTTAPPPGAADPRALAASNSNANVEPAAAPIPEPPAAIAFEPPTPIEPIPNPLPIAAPAPIIPEPAAAPEAAPAIDPSGANRERLTPPNLVAEARRAVDAIPGYQVRLDRQERVGPKLQEKESVMLSIRRSPRAVRIEWPTGPHKGREVLFARGDGPDLMHVNMPGALVPRITLPINSPLAKRNSRHPIDEAGIDSIVGHMERWVEQAPAKAQYLGSEIPPSYGRPCQKLKFEGDDGEIRLVHLDAQTHLPVLVRISAANGDLLEDYSFREIRTDCPELARAEAFDPNSRWGPIKGRANKRKPAETPSEPETEAGTDDTTGGSR